MEKGPLFKFNCLFSEDWVLAHTSVGFTSNFSYLCIDEYIFTEKEKFTVHVFAAHVLYV